MDELQKYRAGLNMYGSMMMDLSRSDDFLEKLHKNKDLTEFESAVRRAILRADR